MYNPKIDEYIESKRDEIFATLKRWIAQYSPAEEPEGYPDDGKPFGEAVRKMLDIALEDGKRLGFDVHNMNGYSGDICMGEGEQTMGMLAHLDVVPIGDGWTHDPLACEMKDGIIYGRGVMDDKGPALAALYAMAAVKNAGIKLKDGVKLILGCDEETGMKDLKYYADRNKMPDYGFSPDAEYPLINIEKGGINIELSAPLPEDIVEMYAGERPNVVPAKAYAVIKKADGSTEKIETTGTSAHGSTPHLGENAMGKLFIKLSEMGIGGAAVKAIAEKFGMEYDGASAGIKADDAECGPLTCNLGMLYIENGMMKVILDIRYPLATSEEKILGQMCYKLTGTPVAVRRLSGRTVLYVPADSKVVKGLLKVYGDITGLPAYPIAIGGGTYSRMMPNTVAFGFNFPDDVDSCHMPDEFVNWEKFILSTKIFAHAIETLAGAEA